MEKEFIPYTEALALKELGFDEPCFAWYGSENIFEISGNYKNSTHTIGYCVSAPLYQQAFRWFREKYFTVGYIIPKNGKYTYHIISNNIKLEMNSFETYEESELECLKELIEIIQTNS
jgi:hypothetical protein